MNRGILVTFLGNIKRIFKQNPYFATALILVLVLPLLVFAAVTPVKTGTKVVCKYNHTVNDDSYTVWVLRWTAEGYKVVVKRIVCEKHKKLEALKRKAIEAQKRGDNQQARDIIGTIKEADPAFQPDEIAAIEEAIAQATGGTSGSQPGTSPPSQDPDQPGQPGGEQPPASGELATYFPVGLTGYKQETDTPGTQVASRLYSADQKVHPTVLLLTIQIARGGSQAGVSAYIDKNVKAYYAADAQTTQVNGLSAYFGTDGQSVAAMAYAIGNIVFVLEMEPASGAPKDLYDELTDLAKDVP